MKRALIPLSILAFAAAVAIAASGIGQAAGITAAPSSMQLSASSSLLTPVGYKRCYRVCVSWSYYGYCVRYKRYCRYYDYDYDY